MREPAIRVTLSQICDKMDERFDRLEAKLEERDRDISELKQQNKYLAGGLTLLGFIVAFFKDPLTSVLGLGVR